jgi:hypothetical protein
MMIRPHRLAGDSTFLGQTCALCKQAFDVGDEIIVCPEDGSRHHSHCWEANNNHCTAYGCQGQGEIGVFVPRRAQSTTPRPAQPRVIDQPPAAPPRQTPTTTRRGRPAPARPIPNAPGSKVRTLPEGSFGCVRGCFMAAIIIAIVLVALVCGLAWWLTDTGMTPAGSRQLIEPVVVAVLRHLPVGL